MNENDFIKELKNTNIVFSVIHGIYGEDGKIQSFLEKNHIPFVGSSSLSCQNAFDKGKSSKIMAKNGFFSLPHIILNKINNDSLKIIRRFFAINNLKRAIVKPTLGGSSIGVYCVYSPNEALEKIKFLLNKKKQSVIIEPFCIGKEFSIIVTQNHKTQKPVALFPTEIEINCNNSPIFDFRKKYLPTNQTRYYTPARFNSSLIEKIRKFSEEIFSLFNLKDIVRIDGWLLDSGKLCFSDINTIPGLEQNSFVFQQASRIGFSHSEFLYYIIKNTCIRYNINFSIISNEDTKLKNVKVLFGGDNAERQVSLMSGVNVWLKLRNSKLYSASPYMLDKNKDVWFLPYMYTLNHTVEETYTNCITAHNNIKKLSVLIKIISKELDIEEYIPELPIKYSFNEFLDLVKKDDSFLFLALHGGDGENGMIQSKLDKLKIKYNGSSANTSKICMDKYMTGTIINNMNDNYILSIPKIKFFINDFDNFQQNDFKLFWDDIVKKLNSSEFIIKPMCDGSSAGIVKVSDFEELKTYIELLKTNVSCILSNTFKNQNVIVEMPSNTKQMFLLESFIETDNINILKGKMTHIKKKGWLELTVGVIEENKKYHSLNPSITIAQNNILSVEEKFQGGTGINITPPPTNLISSEQNNKIKLYIEKVAEVLKIKNYARIDIFFNINTNKMIVIEANTLPALTPSTVLYHQALAEEKPLFPKDFLELLIKINY